MLKGQCSSAAQGRRKIVGRDSSKPSPDGSAEFARLAAAAAGGRATGRPPPRDCGDFDIRIARDGSWFYRGTPIKRAALVKLFSTVLERDGTGAFFLSTPAERGRITVEDAPFVGVELGCEGAGQEQVLTVRTNVDDIVTIDGGHPIRIASGARADEPLPYLHVRDGLEARLLRPVFYELVELGREERVGDTTLFGVWSKGEFFPLGRLDAS
jgi:hypothetical protein